MSVISIFALTIRKFDEKGPLFQVKEYKGNLLSGDTVSFIENDYPKNVSMNYLNNNYFERGFFNSTYYFLTLESLEDFANKTFYYLKSTFEKTLENLEGSNFLSDVDSFLEENEISTEDAFNKAKYLWSQNELNNYTELNGDYGFEISLELYSEKFRFSLKAVLFEKRDNFSVSQSSIDLDNIRCLEYSFEKPMFKKLTVLDYDFEDSTIYDIFTMDLTEDNEVFISRYTPYEYSHYKYLLFSETTESSLKDEVNNILYRNRSFILDIIYSIKDDLSYLGNEFNYSLFDYNLL